MKHQYYIWPTSICYFDLHVCLLFGQLVSQLVKSVLNAHKQVITTSSATRIGSNQSTLNVILHNLTSIGYLKQLTNTKVTIKKRQ